MLSRVADHLYWMSRYLERGQHTARLLDVTLDMIPDRSAVAVARSWDRLFAALHVSLPPAIPRRPRLLTNFLAFDPDNELSIVHHITASRDNARQVRELVSSEMWEQINRLYLEVRRANIGKIWGQSSDFFYAVKQGAHLFQGITDSTMDRGEGWHYIQLGQYLERATNVASLLDIYLGQPASAAPPLHATDVYLEWLGLLRSCTAFEAYCKVYSAELRPDEVAEFLLLNDTFPFSVNFAATQIRAAVAEIADRTDTRKNNPLLRSAGRLKAMLDYQEIGQLLSADLPGYLGEVQGLGESIHQGLHQTYIAYPVEEKLV